MAEVIKGSVVSRTLKRNLDYRAVLPIKFDSSQSNFSVVYLLHGLFGNCDNFIELTCLPDFVDASRLIVVTPDAEDSWYVDSISDENAKFETFFLGELIPAIDGNLPTLRERRNRAVTGISMGGYGALKFAFKRPDLFSFAASSSGAFHAATLSPENMGKGWDEMKDSIMRAFGPADSDTRLTNDLFGIVNDFKGGDLPFIHIDCGKDDGFLDVNRRFSDKLLLNNIPRVYSEFAGGHEWKYWNESVERILRQASLMLVD